MKKYQLQIKLENYDTGNFTIVKELDNLDSISEYKNLIKAINENSDREIWNWWKGLDESWNGYEFIYDKPKISDEFKKKFGVDMDSNLIIKFYNRFTPIGSERIKAVKVVKVEEIEI